MNDEELYAVCLLVIGLPPLRAHLLDWYTYDWRHEAWLREIGGFYRDYHGTKYKEDCQPYMNHFIHAYVKWLSKKVWGHE